MRIILTLFLMKKLLSTQKKHQGAILWEQEIDVLPGETAKEAADRAGEESLEEFRERSKMALDRLAAAMRRSGK